MPRNPKGLPYQRKNRQGKLQYYRRVPVDKRHLFGGKAAFTVVLAIDPSKPTSKAAHTTWATANTEFERRITADTPANPAEDQPSAPIVPLSPRDAAGIAAEPLRNLLNAAESGRDSQEQADLVASVALIALQGMKKAIDTGDIAPAQQAKADITQKFVGDLLDQLNIQPDSRAMAQVERRLFQYLQPLSSDLKKQAGGDFSPSELQRITPPLP